MDQQIPRVPGDEPGESGRGRGVPAALPRRALSRLGVSSAALFLVLLLHAWTVRPDVADSLDARIMIRVQRLDPPGIERWLDAVETLTDSGGAVVAWFVTVAVFAALRWWLPALVTLGLPVGGLINETIGRVLVERTRPRLEVFDRTSLNFEDRSFPSGHVVGAVLLYGLIWYVVGRRIRFAPFRWLIRLACGVVIVLTGFDRVWNGSHWPTDVIAGYALGFALLVALIRISEWIEREAAIVVFGSLVGADVRQRPQAGPVDRIASAWLASILVRWRWIAERVVAMPESSPNVPTNRGVCNVGAHDRPLMPEDDGHRLTSI